MCDPKLACEYATSCRRCARTCQEMKDQKMKSPQRPENVKNQSEFKGKILIYSGLLRAVGGLRCGWLLVAAPYFVPNVFHALLDCAARSLGDFFGVFPGSLGDFLRVLGHRLRVLG